MLTFVQLFKLSYVIVISLIEFSRCYFEEEFEDTKVVIRQLNDQKKKDRQLNDQKKDRQLNDQKKERQLNDQKKKDRQLNDQKKKWKKTNNDHTYDKTYTEN